MTRNVGILTFWYRLASLLFRTRAGVVVCVIASGRCVSRVVVGSIRDHHGMGSFSGALFIEEEEGVLLLRHETLSERVSLETFFIG